MSKGKQEAAQLKAANAFLHRQNGALKRSVQEMTMSIKDLVAELEEQLEISSELILSMNELGYEVFHKGVLLRVEPEAECEGTGTDDPADADALRSGAGLRSDVGEDAGQVQG